MNQRRGNQVRAVDVPAEPFRAARPGGVRLGRLASRWGVLLLAGALVAAGCSSDDDSSDGGSSDTAAADSEAPSVVVELPSGEMSADDVALIDAAAQGMIENSLGGIPAVYVGVWDPERGSYVAAYGDAEIGTRPADPGDSVRIGSISKTFTAVVLLGLVDDGKVDLAAAVETYVPDLVEQFPGLEGLTVEQLLRMESGIPDYLNVPDGVLADVTEDPTRVWEPEELIAAGFAGDVAQPGTPGYSTTNFIVLQEIIEAVSGSSLPDLVDQELTSPLGLDVTALPPADDTTLPDPQSHGYLTELCSGEVEATGGEAEVGTDVTDWSASYGQGGGGMHSVIEELGLWAASTSGNVFLSDELAADRLEMNDIGIPDVPYGMGIMAFGPWIGHEGDSIGWESLAVHDPTTGATFAAATNTCGDASTLLFSLLAAIYPDAPPL